MRGKIESNEKGGGERGRKIKERERGRGEEDKREGGNAAN
jgi:hypothetical protein